MKWTFFILILFILIVSICVLLFSFQSKTKILGSATDVTPSVIISLINLKRSQFGLPSLEPEPHLMNAAHAKAQDLIDRHYFSHISDDQVTPWYFISESGYEYQAAGENLARNFSNSESLVDAWMKSPSHQANLLNRQYSQIGVDVQANYVVAIFASPILPNSNLTPYHSSELVDALTMTSTLLLISVSLTLIFSLIYLLYRLQKHSKLLHPYKPSLTLWYS